MRQAWLSLLLALGATVLMFSELSSAAASQSTSTATPTSSTQTTPATAPKTKGKSAVTSAASPLKDKTGAGHHYGGEEQDNYGSGYEKQGYSSGPDYGGGYEAYAYGNKHHLVDDFICDLDASILVVTNSHKKYSKKEGYGEDKKEEYGGKSGYGDKEGGYGGQEGDYGNNNNYKQQGGYYEAPQKPYVYSQDSYGGPEQGYGGFQPGYEHSQQGFRDNGEYGPEGGYDGQGYDNGGYGQHQGYGKQNYGYENHQPSIAHRLRCSKIAINNDSDCTTCCQLAARRDRSISKDSIFGFIIDYDQVNYSNNYRKKRDVEAQPPGISPPTLSPAHQPAPHSLPSQPQYQAQKSVHSNYPAGPAPAYQGGQPDYYAKNNDNYNNAGGKDYYSGKPEGGYGSPAGGYGGYKMNRPYSLPFPPYNPRCVCCAPKLQHHGYGQFNYKPSYRGNYGGGNGGYGYSSSYSLPAQHSYGYKQQQNGYSQQQGGYGGDYAQPSQGYGSNQNYGTGYGGNQGYEGPNNYGSGGYGPLPKSPSYGGGYEGLKQKNYFGGNAYGK